MATDFWEEIDLLMFRMQKDFSKLKKLLKKNRQRDQKGIVYQDLLEPVSCDLVAEVLNIKPYNVALNVSARKFPLLLKGKKYYCQASDAAEIWPKFKSYWQKKNGRKRKSTVEKKSPD